MAINLYTLNTSEIIPQKNQSTPQTYRIDQNALRENLAKNKASATDLIKESQKNGSYRESASLNGIGVSGMTAGNGAYCNYSSAAFFRKDMPALTDNDGSYMICGETFTQEELVGCRSVMKLAADGIGCGIGKNSNVDYKNYAEMEIASAGVKAYASKNLTEKKAGIVNKAMREYNDALIRHQDDFLTDAVERKGDELSKYYGKGMPVPEEVFGVTKSGDVIATTQVATNEELIGKIKELFSSMDFSDSSSIDHIVGKYKELITPAKLALGVKDEGGYLDSSINHDIEGFQNQFRNMMNVVGYHAVDCMA